MSIEGGAALVIFWLIEGGALLVNFWRIEGGALLVIYWRIEGWTVLVIFPVGVQFEKSFHPMRSKQGAVEALKTTEQ